jgi:hypothetical protein
MGRDYNPCFSFFKLSKQRAKLKPRVFGDMISYFFGHLSVFIFIIIWGIISVEVSLMLN